MKMNENFSLNDNIESTGYRENLEAKETKEYNDYLDGLPLQELRTITTELILKDITIQKGFENNQTQLSNNFINKLSQAAEIQEIPKNQELLNYFDINNESITELNENLDLLGLDITQALEVFQNKLENDISFLPDEYKDKIRLSIKNTLSNLGDVFDDYKNECTDENGNLDEKEFKRNRWIINGKICDRFNFLSYELIPSIEFSQKYSANKNIDISNFTEETIDYGYENSTGYQSNIAGGYILENIGIVKNPDYVDIQKHIGETKDVLNGKIEENGRFNKRLGFDFTDTFDLSKEPHRELLELYGIEGTEISLINEADQNIENQAMFAYLASIIAQMLPYIGAGASVPVDLIDAFSAQDGTLTTLQTFGAINPEFKIDKAWYDNLLGGVALVGTVFGLQAIGKSRKIAKLGKAFSKIDPKTISQIRKIIKAGEKLDEINLKNYEVINQIASLSKKDKLKFAKKFVGNIDEAKELSLLKAHNVGDGREGAKIFEYTNKEVFDKMQILEEGGFNENEVKFFIQTGICGEGGNLDDIRKVEIVTFTEKALNNDNLKLKELNSTLNKIDISIQHDIKNTNAFTNINAKGTIGKIWNEITSLEEGTEGYKNAVESFKSIIYSLNNGSHEVDEYYNLLQKNLGGYLEKKYNQYMDIENQIFDLNTDLFKQKELVKELSITPIEKIDKFLYTFIDDIDKYTGVKSGGKIADRKQFKNDIILNIKKFEIWQNYRKEKFGIGEGKLLNATDKFLETINTSLTFQFKKEIKLKRLEEVILFINKE